MSSNLPVRRKSRWRYCRRVKGQSQYVDIQIQCGIGHDLLLRLHQPQQDVAGQEPGKHQHDTEYGAGDQGGVDGGLHPCVVFGAEQLGDDDGDPMLQPKAKAMKIRVIS